jgi:DNA-binding IclR family transcriptional regulator
MSKENEKDTIKAAETVFDIIELLEAEQSLRLADIADRLEYSESTVYYYLNTLNNRRAVFRAADGYELGPAFLRLGQRVQEKSKLWETGRSLVDDLAHQTGFLACAAVEFEGVAVVYTEHPRPSGTTSSTVQHGLETPLHTTAYGKAILANRSLEYVESYIESHGVPNPDEMVDQLLTVQSNGYAFSDGSVREGMRSIAAPIVAADGKMVLGSVGVTGPTDQIENPNKYKKERRFVSETLDQVQQTAGSIADRL